MCFDVKSSLIAWAISTAAATYLWQRNENYDRWNAKFIVSFSLIQLFEAGIWNGMKTGNRKQNDLFTKLILLGLFAQPLVQSAGALSSVSNGAGSALLRVMVVVFMIMFLMKLVRVMTSEPGQFHSTIGPNGHLVWHDGKQGLFHPKYFLILYLFGLFLPLIFMKRGKGIPLLLVGFATVLYSISVAGKGEIGSYWCYIAVIYSFVAILI